ncbi:unnamed protein product [Prunus armeniaca]
MPPKQHVLAGLGKRKVTRVAILARLRRYLINLIRVPPSHGPGVPETRGANVKRADKIERNHFYSEDNINSEANFNPKATLGIHGGFKINICISEKV